MTTRPNQSNALIIAGLVVTSGMGAAACGNESGGSETPDASAPAPNGPIDEGAPLEDASVLPPIEIEEACSDEPPDEFDATAEGDFSIEIGKQEETGEREYSSLGMGCELPVRVTFQGAAFVRFALRIPVDELLDEAGGVTALTVRLTVTNPDDPDAPEATTEISRPQTPQCFDDGYCYVVPVLAQVAFLAVTLDGQPVVAEFELATEDGSLSAAVNTWAVLRSE